MAAEGIAGGNPPSVNLWIGNLSPEVSEAELKALLEKYGEVESISAHPSRNFAFVYFTKVEDAKSAKEGLQGYALRGKHLKIEFARPTKPCKSLWVTGISPSDARDELEKKFLKYGQIQDFRFLKDGTTAFVDYVQLEDAIEALKDLNGKRFGNSHFRVDYLRSQSAKRPLLPVGPQQGYFPVSNVLLIQHPPSVIIEEEMLHYAMILFGEIENIRIFSDRNCALVEFRSSEEARRAKEGLQGKLFNDPRISIDFFVTESPFARGPVSEYPIPPGNHIIPQGNAPGLLPLGTKIHEPDMYVHPTLISQGAFKPDLNYLMQNGGPQMLIGEPNWRASPTNGIAGSTQPGFNVLKRPASSAWDVHEANLLRDPKRSRVETASPGAVDKYVGVDGEYGSYPRNVEPLSSMAGHRKRHSDGDCIWRGLIAKGGTPVCHARCVAIGEGLDSDMPKVVNCSARTGLDLLAKHYEDALGFDVVFFLPDSEDDFASYTEFLRYLGSNDRAGVAKFDDGTTLFLVPPSNFLYKVLKVSGPERLYGVVLKFPPTVPEVMPINQPPVHLPQSDPRNMAKAQRGYANFPSEERTLSFNPSKAPEESIAPPRAPLPVSGMFPAQSVSTTAPVSQAAVSLTPELIATLTSLLPVKNVSSLPPNPSVPVAMSIGASGVEPNVGQWKNEHVQDQNGQLVQQLGQFSSQFQHLQASQAPPVVSNSYGQIDERSTALTHSAAFPQQTVNRPQVGSFPAAQDDAQRLYNSSYIQQPAYPMGLPNQAQVSGGLSLPQAYNPLQPESISSQIQLNQTSSLGVQEAAESEADKNKRYKSTLLFAANLLSKIQQPSSNQPSQGAGS